MYDTECSMKPIHRDIPHMSKVLIIDDDEQVCEILATTFGRMGHTTARAETLQQGLEKMKLVYLQDLVSATRGDIAECCNRSGLSRSQMYRLIQQYNLKTG